MTSPARELRTKAQEIWNGAIVHSRGRNWIRHQHPNDSARFMLDASIGPIHYGSSDDQEIDTAWQADTGAWQYKMILAGYNAHARNILNVGDIINYSEPVTGENVTFQPLGLNWVDNVSGSRQQLAIPQAVTATVNDDTLNWENGYGTGRHFSWQAQTARLLKVLKIDSTANIPAPTVSNPYLELEFIVKYSAGLTILIDGLEWNKRDKVTTSTSIEFRQTSTGNVLWYFRKPLAWDSGGNDSSGIMQVERRGATQYVTVRWPKSWVDAAIFPIHLDATVDSQLGTASSNDGFDQYDYGGFLTTQTYVRCGKRYGSKDHGFFRFTGISIAGTITTSYIELAGSTTVGTPTLKIYGVDEDNPDAPTTHTEFNADALTTNSVDWNVAFGTSPAPYWNQSSSINSILQELVDSYTISSDAIIIEVWDFTSSDDNYNEVYDYSGNSSYAAKLHIEYSTGPSSSVSVSVSPSVSRSVSPSASESASVSPSEAIVGTVCWGHITGVLEDNTRTFTSNWTGTGTIENSGDSERIRLDPGEYMESEVVFTGEFTIQLLQNEYATGDTVTLKYRHGATSGACTSASWNTYASPFDSLGYVQVRVEA